MVKNVLVIQFSVSRSAIQNFHIFTVSLETRSEGHSSSHSTQALTLLMQNKSDRNIVRDVLWKHK